VNVTDDPRQKGFADAVIVILIGRSGLTITGYMRLDAGLLVVQVSEDVKVQETRSPFIGVNV